MSKAEAKPGGPGLRPPAVGPDDLVVRTFAAPGRDGQPALTLPYRLYVPRDYLQSRRYPLLVVLHGSGEKGTDNVAQLANGVLAFCAPALQKRWPTFVIYPQCPPEARWVEAPWGEGRYSLDETPLSRPSAALLALIEALAGEFTLDPRRTLVAGLSMGGYGTWDLLTRFPDRFAAGMPICGGGDPSKASRLVGLPIWAFHGARDAVVPVAGSRAMVQAVRKAASRGASVEANAGANGSGGQIRYTEYPEVGHDSWHRAFADRRALVWLLSRPARGAGPGGAR